MVESPKAFRNILNVSAAGTSFRKQNLMALLCSIESDIVKIEKCTLGCLINTSVNILLMMILTWNSAQMSSTVLPTQEKSSPRSLNWKFTSLFAHSSIFHIFFVPFWIVWKNGKPSLRIAKKFCQKRILICIESLDTNYTFYSSSKHTKAHRMNI